MLTGVVSPNTGRSGIVLSIGGIKHKIELPVGKYPYTISSAEQNCSLIVHIVGELSLYIQLISPSSFKTSGWYGVCPP